jgi:hypothetical protein
VIDVLVAVLMGMIVMFFVNIVTKAKTLQNQHHQETTQHCQPGNKCVTGDATIDNTGVQETFEYIYNKSDFDLPIDQRTEQGGWITKNPISDDFGFTEFPSDWPRYACGIGMPQSWVNAAPSNTVGMVHTHPFYENDDTTAPNVCGEEYGTEDWSSGFGEDDLQALIDLANHLNDHTIKGYVIDGNNIVT